MKVLRDIVCSNAPYGEMYTDDLIGTVVLNDSKFEGVLRDNYETEYFTFGNINSDSIAMIVSSEQDRELPKIYECKLDNKMYCGDKSVINSYVKIAIEECKMAIYDPDKYRNIGTGELELIERKTEFMKNSLGEESKLLYQKLMEDTTSKISVK